MIKHFLFFCLFCGISFAINAAAEPILSLPFNGNANDMSGNNYHGTLPASGVSDTVDRFGTASSAFYFDGTGFIETAAKQENVTEYSVSAWVKMNADEYGSIVTNRNDGSAICAGIIFEVTNVGTVRMATNGKDYLRSMISQDDIRDGQWHHIAGVFNCPASIAVSNDNFKIFIDGIEVPTTPWAKGDPQTSPISGNGFTRIGEFYDAIGSDLSSGSTKGIVDDVRIYESVLSETDIASMYSEGGYQPQNAIYLANGLYTTSTDPSAQYVSVPEGAWFNGDFTVETWVNLKHRGSGWQRIFDFGTGDGTQNNVVLTSGNPGNYGHSADCPVFMVAHSTVDFTRFFITEPIPLNEWTQVSISFDAASQTASIYYNGRFIQSFTNVLVPKNVNRNVNYFGISSYNDLCLHAELDEFRLYNKVLTQDEIIARSHSKLSGDEDSLILYYNFDQSFGLTIKNGAAQNSNATATVHNGGTFVQSLALLTPFIRDEVPLANGFTAHWDSVPGAIEYELVYADNAEFLNNRSKTVQTNHCTIDDLNANITYYKIRAVTAIAQSNWSSAVFFDETASKTNMCYAGAHTISLQNTTDLHIYGKDEHTVSAWVNYDSNSGIYKIYQQSGNDGSGAQKAGKSVHIENGYFTVKYTFFCSADACRNEYWQTFTCPVPLSPKVWNHVAYKQEGNKVFMYINGVQYLPTSAGGAGDNTILPAQLNAQPSTCDAEVGGNLLLDNFQIWKTALPQNSIITYANTPVTGTEPDLAVAYNFDQAEGTQVLDLAQAVETNAVVMNILSYWKPSNAQLTPLVSFTNISDATLTAVWREIENAQYKIEYATNEDLIDPIAQKLTDTVYVFPSPMAATKYYLRIKAVTDSDSSDWSSIFVGSTASLTDSLIAYYPFNSTAENTVSGSVATIVSQVLPDTDRFGTAGTAYRFSGGYLNAGNESNLTGSFTVGVWLKPGNVANQSSVFGKFHRTDEGISGYKCSLGSDGTVEFSLGNGTNLDSAFVDKGIVSGRWQFFVARYSAKDQLLKIYINNILKATVDGVAPPSANTDDLIIGGVSDGGPSRFDGLMDDIRIFGRALSEKELTRLYHNGGWPYTGIELTDGNVFTEQQDAGMLVGSLRPVVSADGNENVDAANFSYSLVNGAGADDNAKFSIAGNKLYSTMILDYTDQKAVSVRIVGQNTDTDVQFERMLTIDIQPDTITEVYDFNSLSGGDLHNQDGWKTKTEYTHCSGESGKVLVAPSKLSSNTSLSIGHNTCGGNAIYTSLANIFPNISFDDMSAQYTLGYDMYASSLQTIVGITPDSLSGVLAFEANQLPDAAESVFLPDGSKLSVAKAVPNEWVRVEMIISDLDRAQAKVSVRARVLATANSSWMQIVPPTEFAVDTVTVGARNNPASWTGIYMYIAESGGQIDNLSFTKRTMNKKRSTINDGLIAWYKMDNSTEDASENELHGTDAIDGGSSPVGAKDRFGKENAAYQFTNGYCNFQVPDFGSAVNNDELSVSVWTKTAGVKNNALLYLSPDDAENRLAIHTRYNDRVYLDYGNANGTGRNYTEPLSDLSSGWEHYVFVSSNEGNYSKIYKDNKLICTKTGQHTFSADGRTLIIGGFSTIYFDGYVDDMRFYDRALSEDEIASLYSEGGWPVQQILLPANTYIKKGSSQQLSVDVFPADAPKDKLIYSSGNPSIATIDNTGLITAVKEGLVLITAMTENGSVSATTVVNVTAELSAISSIAIADAEKTIIAGQRLKLASDHNPKPAYTSEVHWTSSNTFVATVDDGGNVTGVGKGETVIYVFADNDETIKDSCIVTVLPSLVPKVHSSDTMQYAFKAVSKTNGTWDASDTLRVDVQQFFSDDDVLRYSYTPASFFADTMQTVLHGQYLKIFQKDTVPQVLPLFITITATDPDGQSAVKNVSVAIKEVPDVAPVIDSVPVLPILLPFRKSISVDLAGYVYDDYTPFEQLAYDSFTLNYENVLDVEHGMLTLTIDNSNIAEAFKDTLAFMVVDSRNQKASVRIPYEYKFVVNEAPQSTYSVLDTLKQTADETITVDVSQYVTDDYTPLDQLVWSVNKAENVNVTLDGTVLSASASSSAWNGTEDIIVNVTDEGSAIGKVVIPFRHTTDITLSGYPQVGIALTLANDAELPAVIQKGTQIKANLEDRSGGTIGVTAWSWTFSNADTSFTVSGKPDQLVTLGEYGLYSVRLDAFNGTSGFENGTTVLLPNAVAVAGIVAEKLLVCQDSMVTLSSSYIDASNEYRWSNGATTATIDVDPAKATNYTLTITNNADEFTDSVEIAVQQLIADVFPDTSYCEGLAGGFEIEPQGFSTIYWNGVPDHTDTYAVTETDTVIVEAWIDDLGTCPSVIDTIIVTQLDAIEIGLPDTLAICDGIKDTLIAYGGLKPADYIWNDATNRGDTLVVETKGVFSVTVTAANGCQYSDSTMVYENATPAVSVSVDLAEVCPRDTVQLTATVSAGVTYQWQNGVTADGKATPVITGNNTYTVTASSEHGCENTASVTVAVLDAPEVSALADNDTVCAGSSVTVHATGADTYAWSGGVQSGQAFIPEESGRYTVTGAVDGGCNDTASVFITLLDLPAVTITASDDSICRGDSVTLSASGGVSATWNLGVEDNVLFIPDVSNTYTVTVTDANNCSSQDSIKVDVFALPTIEVIATPSEICIGDSVQLTASGAADYMWSVSLTSDNYYTPGAVADERIDVSAVDANGCKASGSVEVQTFAIPALTITDRTSIDTVCANSSVVLEANGADTYVWSHGGANGSVVVPEASTMYTVIGTANGCSAKDSVKIVLNGNASSPITLNTESFVEVCENTSVTLSADGLFVHLEWNNNVVNGEPFTPDSSDVFIVTAIDGNNCTVMESVTVTVHELPAVSVNPADTTICPSERITLTASGATEYVWDNGVENGVAFSPSVNNTYHVTGTDTHGCVGTASSAVNVHTVYADQIGVATNRPDGSALVVAWEATKGKQLSYYELQKFDDASSEFETVKTFMPEDSTFYTDLDADGNLKSYSYRLLSYDSVCPGSYATSAVHSTIHLSKDQSTEENTVGLKWNAYVGLDVERYYIYAIQDGQIVDSLIEGVSDKTKQFYTRSYPNHVDGNRYQIAFDLPKVFSANRLKNDSGPFSQSMSNLSEAVVKTGSANSNLFADIYPVPVLDFLTIDSRTVPVQCLIFNCEGVLVKQVENAATVDVSDLPAGLYGMTMQFDDQQIARTFVKE